MFISPKRKNTILEMALKSFILSKLDHQMSKSWKRIIAHAFETTNKFDRLKNWPDWSAQDRISAKNILDSKYDMSSRCISSPAGKIQILFFIFTTSLWACSAENSPLKLKKALKKLYDRCFAGNIYWAWQRYQ